MNAVSQVSNCRKNTHMRTRGANLVSNQRYADEDETSIKLWIKKN